MMVLGFIGLAVSKLDARWEAVRDAVAPAMPISQIDETITYREDVRDEWVAPARTLARGYGDCEDIALLKRAALLASGVPDRDILFLIVWDKIAHRFHAVLVVRGHVLDSAGRLSLPVAKVNNYMPVTGWVGRQRYIFGQRL